MTYRQSEATGSTAPSERKSCIVFSAMLLLVLFAVLFPGIPAQTQLGILWTGAGLLMLILPPEVRTAKTWNLMTIGFILLSAVGFFPASWFTIPPWRKELELMGLETGKQTFVNAQGALEAWLGFAVTAVVALYLFGHRVEGGIHHRLATGFALGVGICATMALLLHQPGEVFGFFPNRNHTATLLAMGTFAGLGSFSRAIQMKNGWMIALSAIPTLICLYCLLIVSVSRGGVVMITGGFIVWIALTGFRVIQGHTGKAVLSLLVAFVGLFFIVESTVKTRLSETIGRIEVGKNTQNETNPAFQETATAPNKPELDGRISIFKDTWVMIRHEPWTGVGPGQFVWVFPQYRERTEAPNEAKCLHPESDWFMMLAETGWPAALCLLAGTVLVLHTALTRAWSGRARALRMGTIVAAMILCLHGIFDVPGHRIGLAWAAALLLAISLRPTQGRENTPLPRPHTLALFGWRFIGLAIAITGGVLLHAQSSGDPVLPSVRTARLLDEAKFLYAADQKAYEVAKAEGREYDLPAADDPLEKAITKLGEAIAITPLDPSLHYFRGALALHFTDRPTIVSKAFAIQLKLDPSRIRSPMDQALAWSTQNPEQVRILWEEALRRATEMQARLPQCDPNPRSIFQAMMQVAGKDEDLILAALKLAGDRTELVNLWAQAAPPALLDREMPSVITKTWIPEDRKKLLSSWGARGSKSDVDVFNRAHPELDGVGE